MKWVGNIFVVLSGVGLMSVFSWARWGNVALRSLLSLLEWLTPATTVVSLITVLLLLIACRFEVSRLIRLLKRRVSSL